MRWGKVLTITEYMIVMGRRWAYVAIGITLIFPVLWLVLLKVVGNPQYVNYFIVGTVVNASFLVPFIGTTQDMGYFKRASSIYTMLSSNGADDLDIAIGYLLHTAILNTPVIIALLSASIVIMGASFGVVEILAATGAALLISLISALLGYSLGISIRNYRISNQLSQIVPWPLLLLAPVYYPASVLPEALRYISMAMPTTYMALAVNGVLNLDLHQAATGLAGLSIYAFISIAIAKYAMHRSERYG
ncbi:MAG: ABC transporter permease [Pyrobaculum sp.]|uniref:ABC transporter permease n=1 Tax=Pyrobaculum sp. TaxID=2004705 RepID=UPI003EE9399D